MMISISYDNVISCYWFFIFLKDNIEIIPKLKSKKIQWIDEFI